MAKADAAFVRTDRLWFNVKDFGAKGDLTGDDTAAIQAAVDRAQEVAAGGLGATIFFPAGLYLVNGQVDIPNNLSLRFLGSGMGWTGNNGESTAGKITYLRRSTAYSDPDNSMFQALGVASDRANVAFENMLIDGKGSTGISESKPLIEIANSNELILRNLQLRDHNDNNGDGWPALWLSSVFNATFDNLYLTDCGSPGNFAGSAGQGAAMWVGGPTNTLNATNLEFEGCEGTDLWIGTDAGTATSGCMFTNLKFERGATNDPAAKPHIRIGPLAQSIMFTNVFMPAFRAVPMIVQDTPATSPTAFNNLYMTGEATFDDPDYFIDVQAGSMMLSNTYFSIPSVGAEPNIAFIHLGVDVDDFKFDGIVDDPTILVDDDRAAPGVSPRVVYQT